MAGDNETFLRLNRSEAGLEPGTARSVGQRLTHWAIGAPLKEKEDKKEKKTECMKHHKLHWSNLSASRLIWIPRFVEVHD